MSVKKPAIGIHLGLTNCCIGVWEHDRVEIVANGLGNRRTPTYVGFTGDVISLGEAAKEQSNLNPLNTVFDAKRLIALEIHKDCIPEFIKSLPFNVVGVLATEEDGFIGEDMFFFPRILVNYKGEEKLFTVEEITTIFHLRFPLPTVDGSSSSHMVSLDFASYCTKVRFTQCTSSGCGLLCQ